MEMNNKEFKFFLSCDMNVPLKVKIESLEGETNQNEDMDLDKYQSKRLSDYFSPDYFVECILYIDGKAFGIPYYTRYATYNKSCKWNEWITFCVRICDLSQNTQIGFTVWDLENFEKKIPLGSATFPIFGKKNVFKSGQFKQNLWKNKIADGNVPTSTPGKLPKEERGEIERLEKILNKYENGDVPKIDWLDRLTFRAIEKKFSEKNKIRKSRNLKLIIQLPIFEHSIIFQEIADVDSLFQPIISDKNEIIRIYDPEIDQKLNPCENKQLKLARMLTRGMMDKDLKPNSAERKQIHAIINKAPTIPLSGGEKQILWKFRFSLTTEKKALTKFLRCVDWSDIHETKQAIELMSRWTQIDISDALELLSQDFISEDVRAYAVSVISNAEDFEILIYFLQLVQALKFERFDYSNLAIFLVERSVQNFELANYFHWYLMVEMQDKNFASRFSIIHQNFFSALICSGDEGEKINKQLIIQNEFTSKLINIICDLYNVKGNTSKKIERLHVLLSTQGKMDDLCKFSQDLPLPLNPNILISGINFSECFVFKSALSPICISCLLNNGKKYKFIFKKGDDLRQDQLVIQLLSLMDFLLKKENLDLNLTPYKVLASGIDSGYVEFIPSLPLAQVLSEYKSITRYFQTNHSDESAPYGIKQTCLETFVKSCAGYCVIMYILGVGDRHLDNLLLCEDGKLFHIDFGFILGKDPKPFPPPMKLCKEMVEAMGGAESEHYRQFKSYCCEAFNILRKSSNLILNLFHLMSNSNIHGISSDPEKGIVKLQSKFRLDLDDEGAVQFFQSLINESVSALFPQMVETIHRWAQYWR